MSRQRVFVLTGIAVLLLGTVLGCSSSAPSTSKAPAAAPAAKAPEAAKAAAPAPAAKPAPVTVQIADIQPITGNAAVYGKWATTALDIAVEEINAKGGVQLKVAREDHQANARVAAEALQRLLATAKPSVVVSQITSTIMSMEPVAKENKVLIVNMGAQSAALAGLSPYVYSNIPTNVDEVRAMAQFAVQKQNHKTFAVLYPEDAYGESISKVIKEWIEKAGGQVVFMESHPLGAKDFTSIITKLKDRAPQAMFSGTYGSDMAVLLSQMAQRGVKTAIYGASAYATPEVIKSEPAVGGFYTQVYFDASKNANFTGKFKAKIGDDPTIYAANAYEAGYIIAELADRLTKAGKPVTGENLRADLAANPKVNTPLGEVSFRADGSVKKNLAINKIAAAGKTELVTLLGGD